MRALTWAGRRWPRIAGDYGYILAELQKLSDDDHMSTAL
jgi:hypothetical protein